MKSKWESPTAQELAAPSETPTCLLGPSPTGGGGLCSYACGALTCLSGTGRSITWPRAAAPDVIDSEATAARCVCPDNLF
jgi:hypothetical protein